MSRFGRLSRTLGGAALGIPGLGPLGNLAGGVLGKRSGSGQPSASGGGVPDNPNPFPLRDPNSINPVTGLAPGQSTRRSLSDILSDPGLQAGDANPFFQNNDAAYDAAQSSADTAMKRSNNLGEEAVLNGLQSRGLAKSGIALKDIVSQVLGPQQEQSAALAAKFGLQKASDRTAANAAAQQGRLSSILSSDNADRTMDQQNLQGQQQFRQGQLTGNFGVETNAADNAAKSAIELQKEREARNVANTSRRTGWQDKLIGAGADAGSKLLAGLL